MAIFEFLSALWHHWEPLILGGIVGVLIFVVEHITKRSISWKLIRYIMAAAFFVACFLAWKEEHDKAQTQKAYVRMAVGGDNILPQRLPFYQAYTKAVLNLYELNDSEFLAEHVNFIGALEIHAPATRVTADVTDAPISNSEIENDVFQKMKKDRADSVGQDLSFTPHFREQFTLRSPETLIEDDLNQLRAGIKIMYVVGFIKWTDGAGAHEWPFCRWMHPISDQDTGIVLEDCHTHNSYLAKPQD